MPQLILLNKPFNVLSQFRGGSASGSEPTSKTEPAILTLAAYIKHKGFYPAGRLDKDSEGLLLLTNDGPLQQRISDPRFKLPKTYLVQLEGEIDKSALATLRKGVQLKDGMSRPAQAKTIAEPPLWLRNPPIRERKNIPTCWIELVISEGKNRQVRRMTAAVGYPTLRLVRWRIGPWELAELQPGQSAMISIEGNI